MQHSSGMLVIFFTSWPCVMEAFLAHTNVPSGSEDYLAPLGFYSKVASSNNRKGIRAYIWNTYLLSIRVALHQFLNFKFPYEAGSSGKQRTRFQRRFGSEKTLLTSRESRRVRVVLGTFSKHWKKMAASERSTRFFFSSFLP